MVKIRLTRMGRHKLPYFRMVAMDSRSRRDGEYIKQVGTYEPFKGKVEINEQEVLLLLNQGAQPTDTVKSFLKKAGIWKKFMDSKVQNKKTEAKAPKDKKIVSKQTAKKPVKTVNKTSAKNVSTKKSTVSSKSVSKSNSKKVTKK